MRVTFPRLPDLERSYALVERDDGATYRLYGGPAGPRLPHDIMHFVVERELRIPDGIWAGIASGVVFQGQLLQAEMLANLVGCVAALDHPSDSQIRGLTAARLAVLPDAQVDPVAVAAAATALQVEASRWARLRVGQELTYDWPRGPLAPRTSRARRPHAVRPYKKRERGRRPPRLRREHGGHASSPAGRDHRPGSGAAAAPPRGGPRRRVRGGGRFA
ncbi:MAG: hypothetical protein ACRDOU_01855 [Streptosporangiaceae bacterium]